MTESEVIDRMKSSQSEEEWDRNREAMRATFGGQLPPWWDDQIIHSGVSSEVFSKLDVARMRTLEGK